MDRFLALVEPANSQRIKEEETGQGKMVTLVQGKKLGPNSK